MLEVEESWHGFMGVTGMKKEEENRRERGERRLSLSLSMGIRRNGVGAQKRLSEGGGGGGASGGTRS